MVAPNNYMLNIPDPTQSVMQGVQSGFNLVNTIQQQKANEAALAMKQAEQVRIKQMNQDIGLVSSNPTPTGIASLMTKYPQMSEQFKLTYDVLSNEQQKQHVNVSSQVYAALNANKPEIAQQVLAEKAAAYRNSGDEETAKGYDVFSQLIKESPQLATTTAGMFLANAMGVDKFGETFTKMETERRERNLDPSKMTEAEAKAAKEATAAKFAESQAALDLQKKGWDIRKIQEDISIAKQNSKIAAINAQLAREDNQIKRDRLTMDLDKFTRERNDYVNTKAADVESARMNMDNMLNQADRILKVPNAVMRAAMGGIDASFPTFQEDVLDFESTLETLKSQAFLAQIPNIKGMGALSNAEGEKLQAALQNLSLKQSPEQLTKNVQEAQRLILKARGNISKKYGVPESVPDTPDAQPSAQELDAILKQYGGK